MARINTKIRSLALTVLLVQFVLLTPFVSATTGLEWGIEPGEEFTYVLQRKLVDAENEGFVASYLPFIPGIEEGQKVVATFTEFEELPEVIGSYDELPRSYCTLSRENDSEVLTAGYRIMSVPIGNWSLLREIAGIEATPRLTEYDSDSEWGTINRGQIVVHQTTVNVHEEIRYEKENGTLSYLRLRLSALGNDLVDIVFVHWYPGVPTVLPAEIQLSTILVIGISIAVALIAAIVVYMRRK
ncbi:MAG: hypothetical protein ACOC38_08610 [Promethearchaeia archaeon]